jgi:hypothetical protein
MSPIVLKRKVEGKLKGPKFLLMQDIWQESTNPVTTIKEFVFVLLSISKNTLMLDFWTSGILEFEIEGTVFAEMNENACIGIPCINKAQVLRNCILCNLQYNFVLSPFFAKNGSTKLWQQTRDTLEACS